MASRAVVVIAGAALVDAAAIRGAHQYQNHTDTLYAATAHSTPRFRGHYQQKHTASDQNDDDDEKNAKHTGHHAGHAPDYLIPLKSAHGHFPVESLLQMQQHLTLSEGQLHQLREHHVKVNAYRERLSELPATNGLLHLENIGDSQYVGSLGVGTVISDDPNDPSERPESYVHVVFDTGSTNLWIASSLCKTAGCRSRNQFNPQQSHTFYYKGQYNPSEDPDEFLEKQRLEMQNPSMKKKQGPLFLDITFGTGELQGPMGVDDLHVGSFVVQQQTFALVRREIGKVFDAIRFEGILGLAFPSMSAHNVTPFFDNVIQQKVLTSNEFSFFYTKLPSQASAIFFGGVDPRFFQAPIQMFPVIEPHYWMIHLESMSIGGVPINIDENGDTVNKLILDTGTTYFAVPSFAISKVLGLTKSRLCRDLNQGPTLDIVLRDRDNRKVTLRLDPSEYMVTSVSPENVDAVNNGTLIFLNFDLHALMAPHVSEVRCELQV